MSLVSSSSPALPLVMFHGLASSPKEFGLLTHPLRRLGVALHNPEVPGYSFGSLKPESQWQEWVESACEVVDTFAATSPGPFVLGGLCTGAMLAVAVAARRPQLHLHGLTLLSPLFAYDGWGLPWWYRLRSVAYALGLERHFSMAERSPYGLKNERLRQWVRQQMRTEQATLVGPAQVSLQVVRESERLSSHARACLPELSRPLHVLHAREDEICDLRSVEQALQGVRPDLLTLEVLENSYHMITADNDRQQVAQSLAGFLSAHALAAAA